MPTGSRVGSPIGVFGDTMVNVPIMVGRIGTGLSVLISRVRSSTALGSSAILPKNFVRTSQSSVSSMVRLIA